MFSRQQILHSIISDGQRMLEQGQVDDRYQSSSVHAHSPVYTCPSFIQSCRDEFNLKLALLSNQWQGVVRRAQQRRGIIDGLIRQWQRYREMVEKLQKWLVEVSQPPEGLQTGTTVPLQQARSMLDAVQVCDRCDVTLIGEFSPVSDDCVVVEQLKEKVLQRQQGSYILTVEAGRQLLLSADSRAEVALQAELTEIQERWKHASACLEEQKKELTTLVKVEETNRTVTCTDRLVPPRLTVARLPSPTLS